MNETEEEIVISGISGKFPHCENIEEFSSKLFAGVDMLEMNEKRHTRDLLVPRIGFLNDISKFDTQYFSIHGVQAEVMNPAQRILLELAHEAIIDSGSNPTQIRGSNTGVYVGYSENNYVYLWSKHAPVNDMPLLLTGQAVSLIANMTSYAFDLKGPSMCITSSTSSSMAALHEAFRAIKRGECDGALVAGFNLCQSDYESMYLLQCGVLSPTGISKPFDDKANGFVRSESVCVMYIQKKSQAKRVYTTICNVKIAISGSTHLNEVFASVKRIQKDLLQSVYSEIKLNPLEVEYLEADASGVKVCDEVELNSAADILCKNRKTPLLVGSVKSNMGHAESASGMCAITKMILAMEKGMIPPTINYEKPNSNILSLQNGKMKVTDKSTSYKGGFVAVNNFGYGGSNVYAIFKPNPISVESHITNSLPKLVTVSGKTQESVKHFLEKVEKSKSDYLLRLVHDIHSSNSIRHHFYRGYSIFDTEQPLQDVESYDEVKHPVWFIFPGMGSQYVGMGKDFMQFDAFRESIRKSSDVLERYGIPIYDMINECREDLIHKEIVFVSITVIQCAFVDLLYSLDIHPDGIMGHSMGEASAAYADGALTLEQTVLVAYFKTRGIIESNLPKGSTASVGLSRSEAERHLPDGVYVACDNCDNNVTISGPCDKIQEFVKTLQTQKIFVREVPNPLEFAVHSKYVDPSLPILLKYLQQVIPNPVEFSPKFISSSIPKKDWETDLAKTASAEYIVNNFRSPVLFREALTHIPENAVVVEVAAHCLFQGILKLALPTTCTNIGLAKRQHKYNLEYFLSSIGKLFNLGLLPKIQTLYPDIQYPVPRGTPGISNMVMWDHAKTWKTHSFVEFNRFMGGYKFVFPINPNREEHQYLKGHVLDGHCLFPAAGYLMLVWKSFSAVIGKAIENTSVKFENIRFYRATVLQNNEVEFEVDILASSGTFEIYESKSIVATGKITEVNDPEFITIKSPPLVETSNNISLTADDIYKELRLCHYEYSGEFKGILGANLQDLTCELKWNDNYTTFIDTMLQVCIVGYLGQRKLCVPTGIGEVIINPNKMNLLEKGAKVSVHVNKNMRILQAGGVQISGLRTQVVPMRNLHSAPKLDRYVLIPYSNVNNDKFSESEASEHAISVIIQIVLDNSKFVQPHVVEICNTEEPEGLLTKHIAEILRYEPTVFANYTAFVNNTEKFSEDETLKSLGIKFLTKDSSNKLKNEDIHLLVGTNVLSDGKINNEFLDITKFLKPGAFILLEVSQDVDKPEDNWELVCHYVCSNRQLLLFRMVPQITDPLVITFTEKNFSWINDLKSALKETEADGRRVIVLNQGEKLSGVVGMMNCLKKDYPSHNLRCFFIRDGKAPKFSLEEPFYFNQVQKDLYMNVFNDNSWGCYCHLKLEDTDTKEEEHAHIGIQTPGNLNSLTWIKSPTPTSSNLYHVYYAALNFRDIMLATGKLPVAGEEAGMKNVTLGHEFSGRDQYGNRVFGIVENNGMATTVVSNPKAVFKVPDCWTLEQAATVPIVYATVYLALISQGKMKEGQTILIHAGCGGVGLAAITIALHMGATVYTTVGSQEKRDFLKERFPQLTDRNIANSRDTSFENHVMKETQGRGVDLVLNCLSEEKLLASVRCLRKNGKFLEIGKFDMVMNTSLAMSFFSKNISVHGIDLDDILEHADDTVEKTFESIHQAIVSGVVEPLPTTIYTENSVSEAFKFLSSAKHIGKVLLKFREEEPNQISHAEQKTIPAVLKIYIDPQKVYIIVGGLGGLGLELANWLISRGAKKLVLVSRTGIKDGYQASRIKFWKSMNVTVSISTVDCTEEAGALELLNNSILIGNVGGIFNLAAVLKDDKFENLTEEDFEISCKPKINITRHLDSLSRQLCPELEYFVVFSSINSGKGNFQQCNYGLANSAIERICEARKEANLPAVAIQWGPVDDVGMVAEILHGRSVDVLGMTPQKISSCLSVLDTLLLQTHPIVTSVVLADKNKTLFSKDQDVLDMIGATMGISNIKDMNPNTTLAQLGADSFMVTAIKQTLERDYNKILTTDEIRNLTLGQIKESSSKLKNADKNVMEKTINVADDALPTYIPTEILVKLPSCEIQKQKEVNVYFTSPIQGRVAMLTTLASILPVNVWGLQYSPDVPLDSVQQMASFFVQHLKTVQPNGPYVICGYSSGSLTSFEISLQLEQAGETVILILLDGGVRLFEKEMYLENVPHRDHITDDHVSIVTYMSLCGYTKHKDVLMNLLTMKTFEDMISYVSKTVSKSLNVPEDRVRESLKLFHHKCVVFLSYEPAEKFSGDLILIKSNQYKSSENIDHTYGLNEVCEKEVTVHELDDTQEGIIKNEDSLQFIKNILQSVIEKL